MSKAKKGGRFRRKRSAAPLIGLVASVTVLLILATLAAYFVLSQTIQEDMTEPAAALEHTEQSTQPPTESPTEPPQPVVTADGDSTSLRCKASYTASPEEASALADRVVATAGDAQLTNRQLQIYYLSEISAWQQGEHEAYPDLDQPLDCQDLPFTDSVLSWQHFFLSKALASWQAQQAAAAAAAQPQPVEEAEFEPDPERHEKYIASDLPVNDFLYADRDCYTPNSEHQAWLDSLPELLDQLAQAAGYADSADYLHQVCGENASTEDLVQAAELYNLAYMFFTERSYYIAPTQEQIDGYRQTNAAQLAAQSGGSDTDRTVDIRHILLRPEDAAIAADGTVSASEEQWEECLQQAEKVQKSWKNTYLTTRNPESNFGQVATTTSQDTGTQSSGGLYRSVCPGQLPAELDAWCFDESRQAGDVAILRSDYGYHIVYFCSARDVLDAAAEAALIYEAEQELWQQWTKAASVTCNYSSIVLWADTGAAAVRLEDTLYPDVAHQRFPEAFTFLQQDYPHVMFGHRTVALGGCGVTTLAMLSSYMTDTLITPAQLAAAYPQYRDQNGTKGEAFQEIPADLGYYFDYKTASINEAIQALKQGRVVVNLQVLGHFTRAGHYMLLIRYYEDTDTFQIRDSNIFNYERLEGHKIDQFTRTNILSGTNGFWIMQPKIVQIGACSRCGDGSQICQDYICHKCTAALSRRDNFLSILELTAN